MWWIIVIVIVLIILAFLKYEHYRKTWHVLLLVFLLVIVAVSMNAMMRTGQMNFSSPKTTINSVGIYLGWLGQTSLKLFSVGKDTVLTVGNVIKDTNQTQQKR